METINSTTSIRVPWNKGKLVGQKAPFKLKEIWAIRVRLQIASRCRELALFNLAVDSKLRACDLVQLRVRDVCHGQSDGIAGADPAAKDAEARAVRYHRTHPGCSIGLGQEIGVEFRGFPIPKPNSGITAPVYPPIRPNC
jgi:hypothetical protein